MPKGNVTSSQPQNPVITEGMLTTGRSVAVERAYQWMQSRSWHPAPFQSEAWTHWQQGLSGIVNAPTGSGKTYSLLLPVLFDIHQNKPGAGVRMIWLTPIKALAREIETSALRVIESAGLQVSVGIRTGDTRQEERSRQAKLLPDVLITTPESLHLILARKGYPDLLGMLNLVVADEWHELMGTKRGVQVELALSRLKGINPGLQVWGISATIGNPDDAVVMLHGARQETEPVFVKAQTKKEIDVTSLMPNDVSELPWAGHLGVRMVDKIIPVIRSVKSCLIFTNTRAQCEIWYKRLIEADPDLSGQIAMHHGSLSRELREWVEEAITQGRLRAVVCTSSLDLGVDFAPVEAIIQIGGPKGAARFVQRAGRSGHRPGEPSTIWFLPTHSLELFEAAALRQAIRDEYLEDRVPMIRCFDVLVQYLVTLSLGEGFDAGIIEQEVRKTWCYASMSRDEWNWVLAFITTGGSSLHAYDEFHRVVEKDGRYHISNQRIARRHRMSIGTIVSDTMMAVKRKRGGLVGHIEESFIASLNVGDHFWFAGQGLELTGVKDLTAFVVPSDAATGKIPSWQGGRLPLTSRMSDMLRRKINESVSGNPAGDPELEVIQPVVSIQNERSAVPAPDEFLIEVMQSDEGFHAIFFPFEGRCVHEGLASLFAWRLSQRTRASFSIAFNDYGFELLSNVPLDLADGIGNGLFDMSQLQEDLFRSINAHELSRRKFRELAAISGLVFKGYPGQPVRDRHLQSHAGLIYQVLEDYDPGNLLIQQAMDEVLQYQLEYPRLRKALERIGSNRVVLREVTRPSPFAFPVIVDRLREKMSSETLAERIAGMQLDYSR